MPPCRAALLVAAACQLAGAQFGNLAVDWGTDGSAKLSSSSSKVASTAKVVAGETRRTNLAELAAQGVGRLREVVESFEMGGCDACTADGHWVAKVRQCILEMQTKQLRSQLQLRGVPCESCTQREQFMDKLLDHVHLPVVNTGT